MKGKWRKFEKAKDNSLKVDYRGNFQWFQIIVRMFMFHAIGNFRNVNFSSLSLFLFFFCDKQHKDEGEKNLMCVNCEARRFWHLIKSSHDSLWCRWQINIKREKRGKSNSSHGVDETLISNTTENWQRKLKWKCFLIEKKCRSSSLSSPRHSIRFRIFLVWEWEIYTEFFNE